MVRSQSFGEARRLWSPISSLAAIAVAGSIAWAPSTLVPIAASTVFALAMSEPARAEVDATDPFSDPNSSIFTSLRDAVDPNGRVSEADFRAWALASITDDLSSELSPDEAAEAAAFFTDQAVEAFINAGYGTSDTGFDLDQVITWVVERAEITEGEGSDTGTDSGSNSGSSGDTGNTGSETGSNDADDPTRKMGQGDQSITNTTSITKSEENATGLGAVSGGAVNNDGELSGVQYDASGKAISGNASIINSGNISVSGSYAVAIAAVSLAGTATIQNSGTITVSGENGIGLYAATGHLNFGAPMTEPVFTPGGAVSITNSGGISISGGGDTGAIVGISEGGSVTITNQAAGTIVMSGAAEYEASAIYAATRSGDIEILNFARMTMADQFGILAYSETGDIKATNRATIALGEGDGAAAQGSANLAGIAVRSDEGKVTVENSGTIESTGWVEAAIVAISGLWNDETDALEAEGGGISITNKGTISLGGDAPVGTENEGKSIGIIATSGGSKIEITNTSGAVIEGAQASSTAISADANGGETVIANAGTITGTVKATSGTNRLTNSGTLNGRVEFAGGTGTITNSGAMEGTLSLGSGNDQVTNFGAMSNIIDLGAGTNTLTNSGILSGPVVAGSGADTIRNSGTMLASLDLGAGTNSFTNTASGVFRSLNEVAIGSGNTLTNEGTLSPGGAGTIQATRIIGNFVQTSTGRMTIDVSAASSDTIEIVGRATLAGGLTANIVNLNEVLQSSYTILTATGGFASGSALTVADTAGYDFEVVLSTEEDADGVVTLTAERRTSISSLVSNAISAVAPAGGSGGPANGIVAENISAVGSLLSAVDTNSNTALTPLVNAILLVADSPTAVADALNRLVPQNQGTQTSNTSNSAVAIGNAMFSCTRARRTPEVDT